MNQQENKIGSLGYFNLARGIGMVLILLGHSYILFTPLSQRTQAPLSGLGSVLGGGTMAMFFLISGCGFYKRSPKKCFSIQKRLLLKPYCIVSVAILLTKLLLSVVERRPFRDHGGELVLTYLLGFNAEKGSTFLGIPIDSISIFWFVIALFGGWNLYNAISQLRNRRLQVALVVGCVLLGYLLTLYRKIWPFCLPMALLVVGYLAAGAWINRKGLLECRLRGWSIVLLCVPVVCSAIWGRVNIMTCVWKLGLLDVLSTFCLGFLLMRLFAWIMTLNLHNNLVLGLETLGFNSIWVVSLHAYEKVIFPWYRMDEVVPLGPAGCTLVCFFGRLMLIFLLYQLVCVITQCWKRLRGKKKPKIVIE